jgi:arylsulfatase A-like enzyme
MNVVLVTVDSLRADHVGFLAPGSAPDTPAIDALAGDAFVFENAFANAPYTRASFPAILSGTYPEMYGGYKHLSEERPFLPEHFREAGYATGGFHSNPYLGGQFGYSRGFDHLFSGEEDASILTKLRGFLGRTVPRDSIVFSALQWFRTRAEGLVGSELGTPYVPGDRLNERAIQWLSGTDEPVFLWVHYMDVHHPYVPHEGTPSEGITRSRAIELREKMITQSKTLTDREAEELKRVYCGEVEFVDQCVQDLLDAVDRNCGSEETVIGFLADHGEAFGEHNYWGHPDELHDELIQIPFIIDIPGRSGERSVTPVSTVDLFPTLMTLIDREIPDPCVGESVLNYSGYDADRRERHVFAQASGTKAMVCNRRYKLIRYFEAEKEELFERVKNPGGMERPLADEEGVRAELSTELDEHLKEIEQGQGAAVKDIEMTDDVKRQLEQLGYK